MRLSFEEDLHPDMVLRALGSLTGHPVRLDVGSPELPVFLDVRVLSVAPMGMLGLSVQDMTNGHPRGRPYFVDLATIQELHVY